MATVEYKAGDRYERPYPFSRDTYSAFDDGEDGGGMTDVSTWKVGPKNEADGAGDCLSMADAFGTMVLTVVSVHKPGKYPTRVFFTRTWITPEGKPFGKTKCRMTTMPTFTTLTQGYRHAFVLRGCSCHGCRRLEDHRYGESLAEQATAS